MEKIIRSAPGRIALVGNPFDIYGGSTISLTLKDLRSYVCLEKNNNPEQDISSKIFKPGNNRPNEICQLENAVIEELDLQYDYFKLFDVSDMPYESGLARSTAAVTAMINAFNEMFNLGISDKRDVAEFAWRIERKLGVCGGQERYAIAHDDDERDYRILERRINEADKKLEELEYTRPGKLFYMNFAGRESHRFDNENYAIIEELKIPEDLKIAAAYSKAKKSSFDCHKTLREIYKNSKKGRNIIDEYRDRSVLITNKALGEFKRKSTSLEEIGNSMSGSLDLRFSMFKKLIKDDLGNSPKFKYDSICKESISMKEIAESNGAYGVNQPGSKSIIFLYDDEMPIKELEKKGYHIIKIHK
ncbi:hypothetical protein GF336_04920 [Candidatus Woesearchaeota archaeon]|nr:hypothetical protein [Candidatus Woesearchaeota archaeon]